MNDKLKYVLGFAVIVAICLFALLANPDAEFGGADDAAEGDIAEMDGDYEPWFSPPWEPAGETESMLFALQAAIGGIVIGYFLGGERQRRRSIHMESAEGSEA
jgi:cobalt/nickel transport protein